MKITFLVSYIAILIIVLSSAKHLRDKKMLTSFITGLVIGVMASAINGMINSNYDSYYMLGVSQQMNRLQGANSDPNYFAMTVILALAAMGIFTVKKKRATIVIKALLVVIGLATASTTFYICLCFLIIIKLYTNSSIGKGIKFLMSILLVLLVGVIITYQQDIVAFVLRNYATSNVAIARLMEQMQGLWNDDLATFSSGRFNIWADYLNYFIHQPFHNVLFGGNLSGIYGVGDYYTRESILRASHSTYIDILMSIGIVGFAVFLVAILKNIRATWRNTFSKDNANSKYHQSLLLMKLSILLFYAALSTYPSWYSLLILFI